MEDRSNLFVAAHDGIAGSTWVADALLVLQTTYDLDFVTYHLAATVVADIDNPFVRTTYPDSWVAYYLLNGLVAVDPVAQEGFQRQLPFDWRELEVSPEALVFLEEARRFGIGEHGYSIPVSDKAYRRALLSINSHAPTPVWERMLHDFGDEWIELAHLIHTKAVFELFGEHDPVPRLGPRELECLGWAALGKEYGDIAAILELSESTIRSYLRSARAKLGCATISAATTKALKLHLISV